MNKGGQFLTKESVVLYLFFFGIIYFLYFNNYNLLNNYKWGKENGEGHDIAS